MASITPTEGCRAATGYFAGRLNWECEARVNEGLSLARRTALHGRVAAAIEGFGRAGMAGHPEELEHHWPEALDAAGRESLEQDLLGVMDRFHRSGDDTMVVPAEYLEVVAVKR